jgi:hypothetical protein
VPAGGMATSFGRSIRKIFGPMFLFRAHSAGTLKSVFTRPNELAGMRVTERLTRGASGVPTRRAGDDEGRAGGGGRDFGASLPGADASRQAGANSQANNNGNNKNTMPAQAGSQSDPRTARLRWPIGGPDTLAPGMPETAAGGVLACRRGGAERATDTAVWLFCAKGLQDGPVAPAI